MKFLKQMKQNTLTVWIKSIVYLIIILSPIRALAGGGTVTITSANGGENICATDYSNLSDIIIDEGPSPTNYTSFGMGAGQTLILAAPGGYEFEPGTGTALYTFGRDITDASVTVSTSQITVTLSVGGNIYSDKLTISGIRVKASNGTSVAPQGKILRWSAFAGTAMIDGIFNDVTNFGTLTQSPNMSFVSATTTQLNVSAVPLGGINQVVLGLEIVTMGYCNPISLNQLSLDIGSTSDISQDVSEVKLYYTGNSSNFSPSTLVGSKLNLQPQAYSLDVLQTLAADTNYFWVTYDITNIATLTNFIDAICTQVLIDSIVQTISISDPGNGRLIGLPAIRSAMSGSWNTSASWQGGVVPTQNNHVIIENGHIITLSSNHACSDLSLEGSGQLVLDAYEFNIYGNLTYSVSANILSTDLSKLIISDAGNSGLFKFPSGIINLDQLTLNRAKGAWSDHDIRLDVSDVTPNDSVVLVLSNGILMMNSRPDGAGTPQNLFLEDIDVENDIPFSKTSYVDGRVFRKINSDNAWTTFPVGHKGEIRKAALRASTLNGDENKNSILFRKTAHVDYLNFNVSQLEGGITNKYYWEHNRISSANIARRFSFELTDFPAGFKFSSLLIANYAVLWNSATTPILNDSASNYLEQVNTNAANDLFWTFGSADTLPISNIKSIIQPVSNLNDTIYFPDVNTLLSFDSTSVLPGSPTVTITNQFEDFPQTVVHDSIATLFNANFWSIVSNVSTFNSNVCFDFDSLNFNTPNTNYINLAWQEDNTFGWQILESTPQIYANRICFKTNHFSNWAIATTKPDPKMKSDTVFFNSGSSSDYVEKKFTDSNVNLSLKLESGEKDTVKFSFYEFVPGGNLPTDIEKLGNNFWELSTVQSKVGFLEFDLNGLGLTDSFEYRRVLYRPHAAANWEELPSSRVKKGMKEAMKIKIEGVHSIFGQFNVAKSNVATLSFSHSASSDSSCAGLSSIFKTNITGGTPPFRYTWYGEDGFNSTLSIPKFIFPSGAGSYSYTCVLIDANMVSDTSAGIAKVNVSPIVNLGADTTICNTCSLVLDAGNLGSSYTWSTNETTQLINVSSPNNYVVQVINPVGCGAIDTITIDFFTKVINQLTQAPNQPYTISPNPNNGYFFVHQNNSSLLHYEINIFNAQGIVLYNRKVKRNKGNYAQAINFNGYPAGIYFIVIKNTNTTGKIESSYSKIIITE